MVVYNPPHAYAPPTPTSVPLFTPLPHGVSPQMVCGQYRDRVGTINYSATSCHGSSDQAPPPQS